MIESLWKMIVGSLKISGAKVLNEGMGATRYKRIGVFTYNGRRVVVTIEDHGEQKSGTVLPFNAIRRRQEYVDNGPVNDW